MIPPKQMRVIGTPKAQPRARATARGKFARVYNPKTADGWKQAILLASQSKNLQKKPFLEGVHLRLLFLMPKPKRPKCSVPVGKPDLDNLAKAVMDALTKAGWWKDDAQITTLVVDKQYTYGTAHLSDPGVFIDAWEQE